SAKTSKAFILHQLILYFLSKHKSYPIRAPIGIVAQNIEDIKFQVNKIIIVATN
ncbi:12618_t:CDS:1, partial [Gigaspora margarita]